MSIPGLEHWLSSPQGRYVFDWEQKRIDLAVTDVFGYNALQLGMPQRDLLVENRIPFHQTVGESGHSVIVDVSCDFRQLPFSANSIDLVILPHVLEFHADPHQILHEIERILIPEGEIVITGFNPLSLWGIRRYLPVGKENFPWQGRYFSANRVKDWLQLLGMEVNQPEFGCYAPPCQTQKWLKRWQPIEPIAERFWGIAGGVYILQAVKRVHSMRMILPRWQDKKRRSKVLSPVAQKESPHGQ